MTVYFIKNVFFCVEKFDRIYREKQTKFIEFFRQYLQSLEILIMLLEMLKYK